MNKYGVLYSFTVIQLYKHTDLHSVKLYSKNLASQLFHCQADRLMPEPARLG